MAADLHLVELPRDRAGLGRFLAVPFALYRGEPHWVAPLIADRKKVLGPDNPFFAHARMALWVAVRAGRDVGCVAGVIDDHHNAIHGDRAAFFGFFETVNEPAVSRLLLGAVRAWAGGMGMTRLLGPMNPSINEECGLLVEGFDRPPVLMMTYNPPYYADLIQDAGFAPCKDLLAYYITLDDALQARFDRLSARVLARVPGMSIRPIDTRALAQDLARIQEVYNAAWEDNWGFVPMTDHEFDHMAKEMKAIIRPELVLIAEVKGEPVAFSMTIPDANYALKAAGGRLTKYGLPIGLIKLLLASRKIRRLRLITLGIKEGFRKRGIDAVLYLETITTAKKLGYSGGEISWTLEDNHLVNRAIEMMGGKRTKTYRIYRKAV